MNSANAKIEYVGYFWQLTLPCGDKITVSGIDAQVPNVCPNCGKVFAQIKVTRVPMQEVAPPQRVRC